MTLDDAKKLAVIMSDSSDFIEMHNLLPALNKAFPGVKFAMLSAHDGQFYFVAVEN